VDLVRRRLLEARGDSIARQLWNGLVRAVLDAVRMVVRGVGDLYNLLCACSVSVSLARSSRKGQPISHVIKPNDLSSAAIGLNFMLTAGILSSCGVNVLNVHLWGRHLVKLVNMR
jgi:hypothetical protein